MTQFEAMTMARGEAMIDALTAEFGAHLASKIIEGEALDFLWEARISERYVGRYSGCEFPEHDTRDDLSRIAVLSNYGCGWRVGMCVVDGEGGAIALLWQQCYSTLDEAQIGLGRAH